MIVFGGAAAILVGPGCAPTPNWSQETSYCCTKGDAASAFLTLTSSCPAGFRRIAKDDRANAALFATCGGAPVTVRVGPNSSRAVTSPRNTVPLPTFESQLPVTSPTPLPMPVPSPLPVKPRSCFTECPPGVQNPHCIVGGPAPSTYGPQLARLITTLTRDRQARIDLAPYSTPLAAAPVRLVRGPVVLDNQRLTNSGPPLMLEAAAPALGAIAGIELPTNIEASVERNGPVTIFRLPTTAHGISLRLLNARTRAAHPLDATAAGRILAIETDHQSVFVQTPSACLSSTLPASR